MKLISTLLSLAAFWCGSLFAADVDTSRLRWELPRYAERLRDGGQDRLLVNVPADAAPRQYFALAELDLAPYRGGVLEFSIRWRIAGVKESGSHYPGAVFQLHYRDEVNRDYWPGDGRRLGSFDWRESKFTVDVARDARPGKVRLGLENATGIVEFDLASLKIGSADQFLKDPAAKLTGEDEKEFILLEERLRAALLIQPAPSVEKVADILSRQQADGTFSGIDYKEDNRSAWKTGRHLGMTRDLARSWHDTRDLRTGDAIRKAVGWWSKNLPRSGNWWWNDMYVPQTMADILFLATPLFPEGPEREAALAVCRQSMFLTRYAGNNRVFIAANIFKRAVLERNGRALKASWSALSEEIRLAPTENMTSPVFGGIRADGCYHQHGSQIQFGNYGGEFLTNIAFWSNIWKGTKLALTPEQWQVMRHLAFDGYRWVLYQGDMDLLAVGRQLGKDAAAAKGKRAIDAFNDLGQADPEGPARYREALQPFTGNKFFWNSAYMVHRRPGWYAAVRMNSTRVTPIEDNTNWDNALGRYFSDGVCLVYRSGKEYENITAAWDWTRLPGATLPATPVYTPEESAKIGLKTGGNTPRWTHSRKWRQLGETRFVGGVSDGERGAAVFTQKLDGVEAKKAYFFDREAIRQLGSGITSASPFEVATTVNSCLRRGEIKQGENLIWHDGVAYRGEAMTLVTGERTGDWRYITGGLTEATPVTCDLFRIDIRHGVAPKSAAYAFTILPGKSFAEAAQWNKGKILANTEALQAVEFEDGVVAAVFHAPGRLGSFATDTPGIFLIGKDSLHAADPAAEHTEMTLTLNGQTRKLQLPQGELAGSTVSL